MSPAAGATPLAAVTMLPPLRELSNISLKSIGRSKKNSSGVVVNHDVAPQHPPLPLTPPLPSLQKPSPTNNPRDSYGRISPKALDFASLPNLAAVSSEQQPVETYHELHGDSKPVLRTPRWEERVKQQSGNVYKPRFGGSPNDVTGSDHYYDHRATPDYYPERTLQEQSDSTLTGQASNDASSEIAIASPANCSNNTPSDVITPITTPVTRVPEELSKSTLTSSRSYSTTPDVDSLTTTRRSRRKPKSPHSTLATSSEGIPPLPIPPEKWAQDGNFNKNLSGVRSNTSSPAAAVGSSARRQQSHGNLTDDSSNNTTPDAVGTSSAWRQRSLGNLEGCGSTSTTPEALRNTPTPLSRRAKILDKTLNRLASQTNLVTDDNDGGESARVVEGGLIKRKASTPNLPKRIPLATHVTL